MWTPTDFLDITVVQDDVLNGRRYDAEHCPLALAGSRAVGVVVNVTPALLIVPHSSVWERPIWYCLSAAAVAFQKEFDSNRWDNFDSMLADDIKPITFRLISMNAALRQINPFA